MIVAYAIHWYISDFFDAISYCSLKSEVCFSGFKGLNENENAGGVLITTSVEQNLNLLFKMLKH